MAGTGFFRLAGDGVATAWPAPEGRTAVAGEIGLYFASSQLAVPAATTVAMPAQGRVANLGADANALSNQVSSFAAAPGLATDEAATGPGDRFFDGRALANAGFATPVSAVYVTSASPFLTLPGGT